MAELKPFKALRYKWHVLSDVICPPYDIISNEMKNDLVNISKFNMVNIEVPIASTTQANPYIQASNLLHSWQIDKILLRDQKPSLYFYEQIFEHNGIKITRRGFFSLLKIDNNFVKQHEQTIEKHQTDRLDLLRTTKANTSPIFVLFEDTTNVIVNICIEIAKKLPQAIARDHNGTFHKLWVIYDEKIIYLILEYFRSKIVFIADGHHRYKTACIYKNTEMLKNANSIVNTKHPYDYILAYFCPMEDPGILILPTHRVLDIPLNIEQTITKYFDIYNTTRDFNKALYKLSDDTQSLMVFLNGTFRIITIKKKSLLKQFMPNKSQSYRNLAVSILHNILVQNLKATQFIYVKSDKEALLLARKTGKMAVIVPSVPIKCLKDISLHNEMMPQKSTYFYPKIASGIVIRTL
ncbi:MAG: DUF1015 domain-containing protein [Endomicrobium sp.]|jgi:uncharacterized protein (DUF1015 family)|nr:DUF1015 domain-containing protein [Endomicrobium sp.]